MPKFPATGHVTSTLLVVEFAVVEPETVMTTRSNPVPVQLMVSGLARLRRLGKSNLSP